VNIQTRHDIKGQEWANIDAQLKTRGESKLNFELPEYVQGQIQSDLWNRNQRKSFSAQVEGKNKWGFKHSTVLSQLGRDEPITFATLHLDSRGRQLVKLDGELNRQALSKVDFDFPSTQGNLLIEPSTSQPDKQLVLTVKSKDSAKYAHQTAIKANKNQIEIHQEVQKKNSPSQWKLNSLVDRRSEMPSTFMYEQGQTRAHFAIQPRGERKIASAQLNELFKGYNHHSAVEYEPETHFGLKSETERADGTQLMRMIANMNKDEASSFDLKSRLANGSLYVHPAQNKFSWHMNKATQQY
jgi:hypothetical protein